jgi:hypothetical protein
MFKTMLLHAQVFLISVLFWYCGVQSCVFKKLKYIFFSFKFIYFYIFRSFLFVDVKSKF